jgi:hypothetical protein
MRQPPPLTLAAGRLARWTLGRLEHPLERISGRPDPRPAHVAMSSSASADERRQLMPRI